MVRRGCAAAAAARDYAHQDVIYMILGAIPPKGFPFGGRTLIGDGIPKVPRWKKR